MQLMTVSEFAKVRGLERKRFYYLCVRHLKPVSTRTGRYTGKGNAHNYRIDDLEIAMNYMIKRDGIGGLNFWKHKEFRASLESNAQAPCFIETFNSMREHAETSRFISAMSRAYS